MGRIQRNAIKRRNRWLNHACVFLHSRRQIAFQVSEQPDGNCTMSVRQEGSRLEPLPVEMDFPPHTVPAVIGKLSLGEQIEFREKDGVPAVLSHDPKTCSVVVTSVFGLKTPTGKGEALASLSAAAEACAPWVSSCLARLRAADQAALRFSTTMTVRSSFGSRLPTDSSRRRESWARRSSPVSC
jgi:hypothetical protein